MMSLVGISFAAISLAPLLDTAPAILLHAFAAMAPFGLGVVQFAAPKVTLPHRAIGAIWRGLMAIVDQLVLDPPAPAGRAMEPDPSVVDLHPGDASARRLEGAHAPGRRSPAHHDLPVFRRADRCRAVMLVPGRDHHAVLFGP
jgi:hypothetical protein